MAALNRGQIVTEVIAVTGRTDKTTQIQTYVNWGIKRITRAHLWSELYTFDKTSLDTATNTETVSLSSLTPACRIVLSLVLEDGANSRKLTKVHPRRWDKILSDPSQYTTGKPNWYTKKGTSLYLFKIPNDTYDLWISYSAWPADLAADESTPALTNKDDLIVTATALELSYSIGDANDIKMWEGRYNRMLAMAVRDDMQDPDWAPVARGYNSGAEDIQIGNYWANPFVKEVG